MPLSVRRKSKGFTLLEVMVALAVLAVALGAIIQSLTRHTANASYLRDRTLAHWVAMNKATELQVSRAWPGVGSDKDTAEMANHEWHITTITSDAGTEGVRQIIVEVRKNRDDEGTLGRVIALLGQPS